MKVDIWSDIVCPWCYIGKRRFEAALERFAHRDEVEVTWRAFELDPTAPAERDESHEEHLAAKYGMTREQAGVMIRQMTGRAAEEGLDFRFDLARAGNTFDAHRLLHLAAERGLQDTVKERLMRAYFTEGEPVGDRETLIRLAADAGLDAAEARTVLEGDAYAEDVRTEQSTARSLGISGVPFFVIDRTYGVSGAQPAEVLLEVLEKAWAQAHPLTMVGSHAGGADHRHGGACADGSCAL